MAVVYQYAFVERAKSLLKLAYTAYNIAETTGTDDARDVLEKSFSLEFANRTENDAEDGVELLGVWATLQPTVGSPQGFNLKTGLTDNFGRSVAMAYLHEAVIVVLSASSYVELKAYNEDEGTPWHFANADEIPLYPGDVLFAGYHTTPKDLTSEYYRFYLKTPAASTSSVFMAFLGERLT